MPRILGENNARRLPQSPSSFNKRAIFFKKSPLNVISERAIPVNQKNDGVGEQGGET
jgi:hypothetical protein